MAEPLKYMYNRAFVDAVSAAISGVFPDFDPDAFTAGVFDVDWDARELKARTRHIAVMMHEHLPGDYRAKLKVIREAAPALGDYRYEPMIFPDFVEVYGLDDWEASIPALEQFTQQSSAEFAVRPFIVQDQTRMMAQMNAWANHENFHVRRLASEGCRPRLPWAMALPDFKRDPAPILPILEQLKDDDTDYVRRSVANNLNDISKDHPGVVIEVLRAWQKAETEHTRWITSHALRTLIKKGDADALGLLGFGAEAHLTVKEFTIMPQQVPMGGDVSFSVALKSTADATQNLMIDYVMYFARPKGDPGRKVFKWSKKSLAAREVLRLEKSHSFKPISTRTYHAGTHAIELQVNGQIVARAEFELV